MRKMPATIVPTVTAIGCEYCMRYNRACGRHEAQPGLPSFYGKPIDTPNGHRWAGYAQPVDQLTIREDHQHVTVERVGDDGYLGHFDPYTGEEVKRATGYPVVPPSFLQPLHGIKLR